MSFANINQKQYKTYGIGLCATLKDTRFLSCQQVAESQLSWLRFAAKLLQAGLALAF